MVELSITSMEGMGFESLACIQGFILMDKFYKYNKDIKEEKSLNINFSVLITFGTFGQIVSFCNR
ncbi:MAG: hypothetical protein MUO21_10850 [Nitrososphaeraceae archaeon]|nr:hypothetical protein [Nitrososphaeraceae archaeon]